MTSCPNVIFQSMLFVVMGLAVGIVNHETSAAEVVFAIVGDDDEPVADAVIKFDGVTNDPGDYAFAPATRGIKPFSIVRDGYDSISGQYCTVDYQGDPVRVEVIMQLENEVDVTGVFWYNQNIFCKFEDGHLLMSLDYGHTYTHSIDLSDVASDYRDIKTLWIFEDHSLFFADLTRCFYSHDWETYHESRVYDIDGNPFKPNPRDHNFSRLSYHSNRPIIGDRELYVWGNYSTGSSAYDNINIWMTSDKGVTVRSTYKFRDERMDVDNPILFTRHMHRVDFCPLDNTLWAQTGDHSRQGVHEQHWLLGHYDHLTDTLTWEHLRSGEHAASGNRFKSLNIERHNGYMHWSCDTGNYQGGAFRVPYVPGPGNIEQIVNLAKHEHLKATQNDAAGHYVNDNGEMVVFQLRWGGSGHPHIFHYSPDNGQTWYDIEGPIISHTGSLENYWFGSRFGFIEGIDRLLARPRSLVDRRITVMDTIDLARYVRNIGFFTAFRPVEDVAPSNLFLAGGTIRATDPAGAVIGVLSANGIPSPEFQLVGKHDLVELDSRTKRQLMLKRSVAVENDTHAVIEQVTVKAVNRSGASAPVTFPLQIQCDSDKAR